MSNVDAQELAKFSELAHRWWDPDSEFRPLHQINPLRLAWIDQLAALAGKQVLDVGCGGGILSEAMAGKAQHVTGIDLATQRFQARQKIDQQRFAFLRTHRGEFAERLGECRFHGWFGFFRRRQLGDLALRIRDRPKQLGRRLKFQAATRRE